MSTVWWGQERSKADRPRIVSSQRPPGQQPELVESARKAIRAALEARRAGYTPTWTNRRPADAGMALERLFSEMTEPVLERLNRLPEKSFVEFLRIAGIRPVAATPARALLQFTVSDAAPESTLIAEGFQVGARAADRSGALVIFETEGNFLAAPGKIEELHGQQGSLLRQIDQEATNALGEPIPFLPFGEKARPGRALLIGISGKVAPTVALSVGIQVAAAPGSPPPVGAGGLTPLPVPPPPAIVWEVLDGSSFEVAEVVSDGTAGLGKSGVVALRLPRQWRIGRPPGIETGGLRWLRMRLLHGRYTADPEFVAVRLNVVPAVASRTVRNEVLEAVPGVRGPNARLRLSQTPVIPGTLVLVVEHDEAEITADESAESRDERPDPGAPVTSWRAVDDLAPYGPDARVYVLDPETGILTFGDGLNGRALPRGFRNVRAIRYQVGGGKAGAVEAGQIKMLLSSAAFVTGVTNPTPASGGADAESNQSALIRGPQEIRARGRVVTVADYALLALRSDGAQVARAHAVSGRHPAHPGRPIPGVVAVYIVPPDRGEGAPIPDEQSLDAVARFLSRTVAPAGVEVVAAGPRYHTVRAEVGLVADPDFNTTAVVASTLDALDEYLHPITGGDDKLGWPFGGPLRYSALQRRLLAVGGVSAIVRLNLVVDGVRRPRCSDFMTAANALLWPEGHEVISLDAEGATV